MPKKPAKNLKAIAVRKTPHKENARENSRPRAGFNGRCGVVQEEERTKGKGFRPGMAFCRRGRVRGWRIRQGSLMEVELEWSLFLGARETLLRGGNGSIFHEVPLIYKMTALLFYHSPIFL
jgi:hypothetical protein